MDTKYNEVEITEEEKATLSLPEENDTPSFEVSDDQIPEPEDALAEDDASEEGDFDLDDMELMIGDQTYSSEDIQRWMNDSQNKEDWQASNTQKAQELSKWNKLIDKVNNDEKFREYMGDYFYDNPDELAKLNLDGKAAALDLSEEIQAQPDNPDISRINELEDKVTEIEAEKIADVLESDLDALAQDNPDYFETPQDDIDFLQFCAENNIGDLTAGFMLYTWDDVMDQLNHLEQLQENRDRNKGVVVNTREAGGPEQNAPRSYNSYRDMSLDDPDISKYFDK